MLGAERLLVDRQRALMFARKAYSGYDLRRSERAFIVGLR
jgi:hypothetical protein